MSRMFPGAVVACIHEGRHPRTEEVTRVSERLWLEGVSVCAPDRPELADRFALVALYGCPDSLVAVKRR